MSVNNKVEVRTTKTKECPICGSSEIKDVISRANDYITGDLFQILGCKVCGICFTYPMPYDIESYYPSNYRAYGPHVTRLLRTFYDFRVRKWMKMRDSPGTALEIGCGAGLMLDALRRRGWQVMGLERTEAMAAYTRDTMGLNVISGRFESMAKEMRFDLIILFNVLEHMKDPLSILKECAARLKPGGVILINVPNFDSWQAYLNRPLWLHLDPPRHLFHFAPKSLANVLWMAGLKVSDVSFVSFEHDPYGWIQSAINKITGTHNLLTRYLMGIEGYNQKVIISVILGVLIAIPAVFLSMASWIMKKGALMQVVAVLPGEHDVSK